MNEYIEAWINGLETPGERAYARSQWAFLQEVGPQPNAKDYNLTSVGPGRGRDENRPPINGEGLAES
jgi:hypothetical protein